VSDTHFYEPSKGHGLAHCAFKAIVAPRPIGWFSTVDEAGNVNLAPYSFFNAMCEDPPVVTFSSKGRKDTVRNVERTGEFVANLCTYELAQQMNVSSTAVPSGVDEMMLAGLERASSRMVKPPRVAAAPAALECKSLGITEIKDLSGRGTDWYMVLGQVVGIHIARAYLRDGFFDTAAASPIARCGYRTYYAKVDRLFEMVMPNDLLQQNSA
jgi:flavin reductase (DIM6/NTAB) family NADH-FMN oxidoreductase RutF